MHKNLTSHAALTHNRAYISALQRSMACMLMLLALGFGGSAQAYWTTGSGNAGATPQESCLNDIASLNAALGSGASYYWHPNEPMITRSGELPGGFYNCNMKPLLAGTNTPPPYPPATAHTIYMACINSDETPDREYKQPTGCKQNNSSSNPIFQGNSCPGNCGVENAGGGETTGLSSILPGAVSSSNGSVTGSGSYWTGQGARFMPGATNNKSVANTSSSPVDIASGNAFYSVTDYTSGGGNKLTFARFYNSMTADSSATSLGRNWRHTFDRYITAYGGTYGMVERADGKQFGWSDSTTIPGYAINRTLSSGIYTYTLVTPDDTVETYTASSSTATALLQSITYRNGYTLTLNRPSSTQLTVTDSYSRVLTLNLDSGGYLTSLTTPDSTTINYGYTSSSYYLLYLGIGSSVKRLASVTYPDATSNPVTYAYSGTLSNPAAGVYYYIDTNSDVITPFHMTSVTDQNGRVSHQWVYDKFGRATQTKGYNGTHTTSISYNYTNGERTVTNPAGTVDTISFVTAQGTPRLNVVRRAATASTAASAQAQAYDYYGFVNAAYAWYTYPWYYNSRGDTYAVNLRGLPTTVTENYYVTPISTTYSWITSAAASNYPSGYTYRLPSTITEGIASGSSSGMRSTSFTYDSKGNMLTKTLTDLSGQGQAARTWTYTYDSTGNVLTAQDPRGNTTTFTYSSGRLATITNALSQTVTFSNFTGGGRPQTVTDANGVAHTITYDSRQRITGTSVTVGGTARDTTYSWNMNDELQQILNPDGTSITYGYPYEVASNPLTRTVTDAAGNVATTTLDSGMRPITVKTEDSGSTVALHRNATYDAAGRLKTESNYNNTKTTTYNYDLNDNVTSIVDPLSHTTSFAYDFFNRRTSMTDANSGVTSWTYNSIHNVASVTAPLTTGTPAPVTTYTYNGFGEVKQEVSPDRGTITYVYDNMGNLTQKTDAAGIVTNYTYDALNRLATVAYPSNSALNVTYTYDESGHGKGVGRLTSVADASGTRSISYDERGAVTADTRVISGTSFATAYSYNAAGKLAGITYPGSAAVSYSRDSAGNVSSMGFSASGADSSSVLTSATWLPFGPMKTLTYNDGITETFSYDKDLNLTALSAGGTGNINLSYGYDNAGNLTSITDGITSANSQTLSYDVSNRLTGATSGSGGYGTLAWAYDKNGNLTSSTIGGVTTTFTTTNSTNRIASASGGGNSWSYSYNNNGNITGVTKNSATTTYAYSAANRLASISDGTTTESYLYGADGMRASKTVGGTTSKFVNGLGGQLLAEGTTSTPSLLHIYLGGKLVGQYDTGSSKMLSVHTDRLGTPTLVTDKTKASQWAATYQPYGQIQSVSGSLAENVRLPGQYQDASFNTYNNGFRTFSPGNNTKNVMGGRYYQFDPIGMAGGTNPYAYVGGSPFMYTDRSGLFPDYSKKNNPAFNSPEINFSDYKGWDLAGKAWTLPNTALGLIVGTGAYVGGLIEGTNPSICIANNAIQFLNTPYMGGAITFGNVQIYTTRKTPDSDSETYDRSMYVNTGKHEEGHTPDYQMLGPFFIPYYLASGGWWEPSPLEGKADRYAGCTKCK